MEQTASAALVTAIIAVVLGALGLVAGIVGYVQGSAALRRAILIRQRASAAEEAARGAQASAEQAARAAAEALERLEPTDPGSDSGLLPTMLLAVQDRPVSPGLRERLDAPTPQPPQEPGSAAAPTRPEPAGPAEAEPAADEQSDASSATEPTTSETGRASTGQVGAGGQAAATLDWAEVLDTGAVPLPTRSRGTYSAPGRSASAPRNRAPKAGPGAGEPEPVDSGPIDLVVVDPSGPIRFAVRHIGRQRYVATNLGGTTAEAALVEGAGDDRHLIRPVETRERAVGPGEGLVFSVLRVEGRKVLVQVAWQEGGEDRSVELPIA